MKFLAGLLALVTALALPLPPAQPAPAAAVTPSAPEGVEVVRLAGSNRYGTAAAISQWKHSGSQYVVLARGDDYADALAGVPLAYQLQAPLLLTLPKTLNPETKAEISRLQAQRVIILGGTGAVSAQVQRELEGMGLAVERLAGSNRFDTAAVIAGRLAGLAQPPGAVIVYGLNFPDALAAASYAARQGMPILLSLTQRLPQETAAIIQELNIPKTYVAGGSGVINDQVLAQLPSPTRIAGNNRFATAVALAQHFQPQGDKVFAATGQNFADALAGAAAAARHDAPLLLLEPWGPATARPYSLSRMPKEVIVLGGEGVIPASHAHRLWNLTGDNIRLTQATHLTDTPQGEVRRYPYRGHITQVLADTGTYLQIRFGRVTGWIPRTAAAFTQEPKDYIRLGWQDATTNGNEFLSGPPGESGSNVYAPVQFRVSSGEVIQKTGGYMSLNQLARMQGYPLWVTFQQLVNRSEDTVLSNSLAEDILATALLQDADGIIINFEGMGATNKQAFTEFMTYLKEIATPHNLTLAVTVVRVDNTSRYSTCFDRRALAQICDFVILTAYDQFAPGDRTPGTVSSLPWTEASIQQLVGNPQGPEYVPQEKILLGIPFYWRNWRTGITPAENRVLVTSTIGTNIRSVPSTKNNTPLHRGNLWDNWQYIGKEEHGEEVTHHETGYTSTLWYIINYEGQEAYISSVYSAFLPQGITYPGVVPTPRGLQTTQRILANYCSAARTSRMLDSIIMYDVDIIWDTTAQQTKITWKDSQGWDNVLWLEDFHSLSLRRKLMEKYNLAGLAAWDISWMGTELETWNLLRTEVPLPVYGSQ